VKKKYSVSSKDKKDWEDFTKKTDSITVKEEDLIRKNNREKKIPKLDLHGRSLDEANKIAKKFIIEYYNKGYNKILIVTGKGLRSKSYDDPYTSKNLSILKNSVPEYIKNDENLNSIIIKINQADKKYGGEGAINIFLKNKE
tara:strand:+ start:2489 stop:2914 length:426 start_codon:yes stop_codon:yes gene_type:complete